MGFWIFMLMMDLLIPVTMIIFGKQFMKKSPKEINGIFGYRTTMSMKNRDTWEFAHKYCGKTWYLCGLILLPISLLSMFVVLGKNDTIVGSFAGVVCVMQLIPFAASIIPTEKALKRNFDENGNRR